MLQWIEVCLSVQGTRVPSLVREDPTSLGATKLVATPAEAHTLQSLPGINAMTEPVS